MVHLVLPRLSYPPVTYVMLLVSNNIRSSPRGSVRGQVQVFRTAPHTRVQWQAAEWQAGVHNAPGYGGHPGSRFRERGMEQDLRVTEPHDHAAGVLGVLSRCADRCTIWARSVRLARW